MLTIKLPKITAITNYIQFEDLGIEPEYIEDHSYDLAYFNSDHLPIQHLQTKIYSKRSYEVLKHECDKAKEEYEKWIKSAPFFINIKEK